jgi:hypothetical protein
VTKGVTKFLHEQLLVICVADPPLPLGAVLTAAFLDDLELHV